MNTIWPPLQTKTPWSPLPATSSDTASPLREKRLGLTIGPSDDPLEAEADVVADRVLTGSAGLTNGGSTAHVQRSGARASAPASAAPASVDRVLTTPGDQLDRPLRQDMEQRFNHDFSQVRVHTGPAAERSAGEIGANAYTVGHHIVFGRNQFAPNVHIGRRLLAHELTHVVQQSVEAAGASVLRSQKKKAAPKKPQKCGRNSRKVKDNWITKVNIDVGSDELTIEWNDPKNIPAGSAGTHKISPGAGHCCVNCNDEKVSQTSGSLCTPKGDTWKVSSTGCALAGHPSAKNPTYFQRGGVAIHSGNTSSPPQSHGCARTALSISELIHDNVVKDVTEIASSGTWSSSRCYLKPGSDTLSNRKDVCEGDKLKPKKPAKEANAHGGSFDPAETPNKTLPKASPPQPVAEAPIDTDESPTAQMLEPAVEGLSAAAADGPGPNNEPVAEESIGEIAVEPDSTDRSGEDHA